MKKILKGLALATLVATSVSASTDQTFLQVRPQGVNLAMEATTWRDLLLTQKEDAFGAHFQLVPFYMDSSDSSDIGQYFGIDGKDKFKLSNATAGMDSDIRYMLRAQLFDVDVEYSPNQSAYGARIDYFQDLDKVLKGLYFKVALPIVYVDNDMKLNVTSNTPAQKTDVVDYFKGSFTGAGDNTQEGLTHAKIDGGQNTTDVADIDVVLGYKVINKDNAKLAIEIGLTIPTSNDADGVWVFEPISGNNNHWGLGGDLDFWGKVWEDEDQYIRIDAVLNWRYLFKSSETRTLRLKDDAAIFNTPAAAGANGNYRYTQYRVVGQGNNSAGAVAANAVTSAKPLANISTLNVDVTPGSQLDGILGLAYCNGGFSVELGYNLFWKEKEDLDKKADLPVDYKLLALNSTILENVPALVYDNLDLASAETPSYFTNKIYAGLGYIFKEWDTPLMLGLGGQYEFAGNNEEIENYGIWGKLGIMF